MNIPNVIFRLGLALVCAMLSLWLLGTAVLVLVTMIKAPFHQSMWMALLVSVLVGILFAKCAYSLAKSVYAPATHEEVEPPVSKTWSTARAVGVALIFVFGTFVYRKCIMFVPGEGAFRAANGRQMLGNLGAMRSAMSIYYGDMEAQYPSDLSVFTANNRWGMRIVKADTGMHPSSDAIQLMTAEEVVARSYRDDGGWYYVTRGSNTGSIGINCVHTDVKGSVWNSY